MKDNAIGSNEVALAPLAAGIGRSVLLSDSHLPSGGAISIHADPYIPSNNRPFARQTVSLLGVNRMNAVRASGAGGAISVVSIGTQAQNPYSVLFIRGNFSS